MRSAHWTSTKRRTTCASSRRQSAFPFFTSHESGSLAQKQRKRNPLRSRRSPKRAPNAFRALVAPMKDLAIALEHRPGALAEMGEAHGKAGVSIEGGVWAWDRDAIAHFLFEDAGAAREALEAAGIRVVAEREVVALRLKQEVPGQLGTIARRMADAGVNIEVQYSDHDNRLILVVDEIEKARAISKA